MEPTAEPTMITRASRIRPRAYPEPTKDVTPELNLTPLRTGPEPTRADQGRNPEPTELTQDSHSGTEPEPTQIPVPVPEPTKDVT